MNDKITMKEIAEKTGVSLATVSLVLNNRKGVSEDTRLRVQKVIAQYNYEAKPHKRSEKVFYFLKYSTHGMVVEENQGFISSIMDRIESACSEKGIGVLNRSMNASNMPAVLQSLSDSPVDGVFLLGTEIDQAQAELLRQIKLPLVVVDNAMRNHRIDSVVMANHDIAHEAVMYLFKLGHRDIGYLKSNTSISNFAERSEGFFACLGELGLNPPKPFMLTPTLTGAYLSMKRQLQQKNAALPTAMFADNDTIAIGAIKALKEAGVKVPQDVSIIGIDDIQYSSVVSPGLTTMRISRRQMGNAAVERLWQRVCFPDENPCRVLIGANLVERESTRRLEK